MKFTQLLLIRHFVGKPVVASQNVSCFLKVVISYFEGIERPKYEKTTEFSLAGASNAFLLLPSFREEDIK